MKIVLLVALSALSGAALAQTTTANTDRRAALSDREVMILWEKLMIVTSGETEEDALANLRSHGMGEDGAKALVTFRTKALAELQHDGDRLYLDVCGKQKEIRESGGPEMVAQLVEQSIRREADTRRRLLAEADSLLSLQDQERLEHLYSGGHGPNIDITETNIAMRVRSGEIPVEQAITAACEQLKKSRTSRS